MPCKNLFCIFRLYPACTKSAYLNTDQAALNNYFYPSTEDQQNAVDYHRDADYHSNGDSADYHSDTDYNSNGNDGDNAHEMDEPAPPKTSEEIPAKKVCSYLHYL